MLGIFAVKSAVLSGSVSDPAKSSGIPDLSLNENALYKDAFAMKHRLSLSTDLNGRRIFCQKSERGLKLAVKTDRPKKVSIYISRQFAVNVTRIKRNQDKK